MESELKKEEKEEDPWMDWNGGCYMVESKSEAAERKRFMGMTEMLPFLTNNKDVNILILAKLEFKDLREVLAINRYTSQYNTDILWCNYQQIDLDYDFEKVTLLTIRRAWKEFSLLQYRCQCLFGENYNMAMYERAKEGHRDFADFFVFKGAKWDDGMRGAAEGGHRDLVDFFISKGADDWNFSMEGAAKEGHQELVDFFVSKGAIEW